MIDDENYDELKKVIDIYIYFEIQYNRFISHKTPENKQRIEKIKEKIISLSKNKNFCVGTITMNYFGFHEEFHMVYTKDIFKKIERFCAKNKEKWKEDTLKRQKLSSKKRKPKRIINKKIYDSFQKNSSFYNAFPENIFNLRHKIEEKQKKKHS